MCRIYIQNVNVICEGFLPSFPVNEMESQFFFFFFSVNKYHDLGFDVLSFVEGNDYFLVKI